jgi:hypothetical protein
VDSLEARPSAGEFRFGAEQIADQWVRATAALVSVRPDLAGALAAAGAVLAPNLRRLHDIVTATPYGTPLSSARARRVRTLVPP